MLETFNQQLSQRDGAQRIIPSLELFQHIQQNYQHFQAMSRGHTGERLWELAQTALSKTIEQVLLTASAEKHPPSLPLPVIAQYLAGSFLSLTKWWLQAEMPYTPEQMESFFQQLALPGVRNAIAGKT